MESIRTYFEKKLRPGSLQRQANDVPAPVHSARPTRSPTQRHHPSDTAIDLTSSARSKFRPPPLDPTKNTKLPWEGESSDFRRLVPGHYDAPTDAVAVPRPGKSSAYRPTNNKIMGKPGAELSHKPINNLDRNFGQPTTYGKQSTAKSFNFLDEDPGSICATENYSSAPQPEPARKRRRLDGLLSPAHPKNRDLNPAHEDIFKNTWPPNPRYAGTQSNHSDDGERKRRGTGGSLLHNEYDSTEKLVNTRTRSRSSRVSRGSPATYENGAKITDPIVLDEDSFSHSPSVRQGVSPTSDRKPSNMSIVTTSPYFPNDKAKTSHPTRHRSVLPMNGDSDSIQLRHKFKRSEQAAFEDISDDELALEPLPTRAPRSKAMMERPEIKRPSGGFELECARTPDFDIRGPGLSLRPGKENCYRIARRGAEGVKTISVIPITQIIKGETDEQSRIRLTGSRNADKSQLFVDLQFKSKEELHLFTNEVTRRITSRCMWFKDEQYMAQVFQKPLASTSKLSPTSSTAIPKTASSANALRRGLLGPKDRPEIFDQQKMGSDSDDFSALKSRPGLTVLGGLTRSTRSNKITYGEVEEETLHQPPRYSEIHGLGPRWQHQLTYGTGRHRATVDFSDLLRLDEGEFLNDQLIDFYLLWLFNQTEGLSDKVYIFNTHFFSTLTRKVPGQKTLINYAAVARWTAKEDLFGYDYIVVPINQDAHWYVAIICNVSSIARKPAIDVAQSPTRPQTEVAKSASAVKERSTSPTLSATEPSSTVIPVMNRPVSDDNNEISIDEEPEDCGLDLVDADAIKPLLRSEKVAETVALDSDASETARMRQLSLTEAIPVKESALSGSPSSSKKSRRKSAPPARKWNPDDPTIIILDSLGGTARSQAVRALKDYLRAEGIAKRGMEAEIPQNAFYAKETHIPVQENFYDCGVYLLGYMQKFFENPDKFKNQLLLGEMQAKSSWAEKPMRQIRDLMRDILKDLYQHQEEERRRAKAERKGKKSATIAQSTPVLQQGAASEKQSESSKNVTPKEPEGSPSEPLLDDSAFVGTQNRLASPFEPLLERSEKHSSSPAPIVKVDDSPVPPLHDAERQDNSGPIAHSDLEFGSDCKPDASLTSELNRQPDPIQDEGGSITNAPHMRKPSPAVVIRSPKRSREPTDVTSNGIVEMIEGRYSPLKRQKTQPNQTSRSVQRGVRRPVPRVAPEDLLEDDGEDSGIDAYVPASRGSSQNPITIDETLDEIVVHRPSSRSNDEDDPSLQASQRTISLPGQGTRPRKAPVIELDNQGLVGARLAKDSVKGKPFVGDPLDAALLHAQDSLEDPDRKSESVEGDGSQTTVEDNIWVGVSAPEARRHRSPDEVPSPRTSEVAETPPGERSSPGDTPDAPLSLSP